MQPSKLLNILESVMFENTTSDVLTLEPLSLQVTTHNLIIQVDAHFRLRAVNSLLTWQYFLSL